MISAASATLESSKSPAAAPLMDVSGLGILFGTGAHRIRATRDISFSVAPGERIGIVGESGCGKTITALSLLRLLPAITNTD